MPNSQPSNFTSHHEVADDGTVAFHCSQDAEAWPWLALHPGHPIIVQNMNYLASVEASAARGTLDTAKWSALTETGWTCGDLKAEHAVRGVAQPLSGTGKRAHYWIKFYGARGDLLYDMNGAGVVFQNRDFESWRQQAKTRSGSDPDAPTDGFAYAPASALGVVSDAHRFLSPLRNTSSASATAASADGLVTRANGFPPANPYLDGSGDHVNASHIAEIARQFAGLLTERPGLTVAGGDMRFRRYVELGVPFTVSGEQSRNDITLSLTQRGEPCAEVRLHVKT
ncbi:MAG: hypothetical protein V2J26_13385 [Pacificimonas sp.]|jgi:hypothetical protein|nr:hypothetical protein [Pacificimonas sp.]